MTATLVPASDIQYMLYEIKSVIWQCADEGVVETESGSTFIGPLAQGPLFFLHKIFRGCSNTEISDVATILGFDLPADYVEFLRWSNGAALFDNSLFLYGTRGNLARETSLEALTPPLLSSEVDSYRRVYPSASKAPVGSIVGREKSFLLILHKEGVFSIEDGAGGARKFPCFLQGLIITVNLLSLLSNDRGLLDESGHGVDVEFTAMIGGPS